MAFCEPCSLVLTQSDGRWENIQQHHTQGNSHDQHKECIRNPGKKKACPPANEHEVHSADQEIHLLRSTNVDIRYSTCNVDIYLLTGGLQGEDSWKPVQHQETHWQTNNRKNKEIANVQPDPTCPPADEDEIQGSHENPMLLLLDVYIDNLLWHHHDRLY